MVIQTVPDYVILEVPALVRLRETLYRAYEHLPDPLPEGHIEEELSDSITDIVSSLEQRDVARENLQHMCEAHCTHDVEFDQGQFKFAQRLFEFGQELLDQFHHFRMYYGEEYLPFFYKEQLGHDTIILQRVGYRGSGSE